MCFCETNPNCGGEISDGCYRPIGSWDENENFPIRVRFLGFGAVGGSSASITTHATQWRGYTEKKTQAKAMRLLTIVLKPPDLVAELGGVFVLLGGDGFGELGFEFLEFGEGHVLFDLRGEIVEGFEGALAFELEGVLVGLGQGLDFFGGGPDNEEGFFMAVVGELEHGGGDGVDAEDVGAPLFEVVFVLEAGGVAVDEVEEEEIAGGVADGAAQPGRLIWKRWRWR